MTIRPVRLSDASDLAELLIAAWRWAYAGVIPDDELAGVHRTFRTDTFEERIRGNRHLYLVAVDESDRVIGMSVEGAPAQLPGFQREISGLYVSPASTRSGVGRALVQAMVTEFVATGDRSLCIHTLQANRIGRGFYEKIGGKVAGEDMWRQFPAVWYGWDNMSSILGL